jgi:hypothetical protein
MPSPRVPIVATILKAWADAFRAIAAMPAVALFALVILAVVGVVAWWVSVAVLLNPGRTVLEWLASPTWFVLFLINTSLQIVLLAPLCIAVQRFVIRRDIARRYPLNPLRPSYLNYVAVALAINLAFRLPDLMRVLAPYVLTLSVWIELGIWLLTLALMIAVLIVALRRIALFAAIAVNAPNATWRGIAPADAGNTFRIMLIMLAIWLPGAIYGFLVNSYFPLPGSPYTGGIVLALLIWLPQLPIIGAFAAASARIFMALEAPATATAARDESVAVA